MILSSRVTGCFVTKNEELSCQQLSAILKKTENGGSYVQQKDIISYCTCLQSDRNDFIVPDYFWEQFFKDYDVYRNRVDNFQSVPADKGNHLKMILPITSNAEPFGALFICKKNNIIFI